MESVGNYKFVKVEHLTTALTHPSGGGSSNAFQRLEFMGDTVLNFVISDILMARFAQDSEGSLSKRRARLVSSEVAVLCALSLGLDARLVVGPHVNLRTSSALADAMEAVIGAIYYDSGVDACYGFIETHWGPFIDDCTTVPQDAKTALQEWAHTHKTAVPVYTEISRKGPDHDLTLTCTVHIPGLELPRGVGEARTKKQAEKLAALDYMTRVA